MERVLGAMQTPDGAWRVEIIRRGRTRWYQIVHDDVFYGPMSIAGIERVLDQEGVDRSTLVEVGNDAPAGVGGEHGVA